MFDHRKYQPFPNVHLPDRRWPDQHIQQAPRWCSVDLRDGNQALINPMSVAQKTRLFKLLVKLGLKEIEIGFPAASQPDYDFVRQLIEQQMIPDDVTVQVLVQARETLMERTFAALAGVKKAIVHVYNSTSCVQREQVFNSDRAGIKAIAVEGAQLLKRYAANYPDTQWTFQYSPESFTGTELDYAVEVCSAVIDVWQPGNGQPVIINLPSTVEMSTPNVFADQIEWFSRHLPQREQVTLCLHTHNDRGCAVAAAELGLMAGADRLEGTLMGNGERTGNMDIITVAMNLYSQGIDPQLDLSDIGEVIETVEACTGLATPPRHPWAGELVYTAFSGSHQDAIRKSIAYHQQHNLPHWQVAYLPIDPQDIGRDYDAVVRINSQSGKGGVALVLERDYQITLPKWFHPAISQQVQLASEQSGQEISPAHIYQLFEQHYVAVEPAWLLQRYDIHSEDGAVTVTVELPARQLLGRGNGPIDALCKALGQVSGQSIQVQHFDESALESGRDAKARSCIALLIDQQPYLACATAEDTSAASIQAVLSAFSRSPLANKQVAA